MTTSTTHPSTPPAADGGPGMVARSPRGMREVVRHRDTWLISLLYIGSFGSFIGFGFAFGQVLQVQFKADYPRPIDAAYIAFLSFYGICFIITYIAYVRPSPRNSAAAVSLHQAA